MMEELQLLPTTFQGNYSEMFCTSAVIDRIIRVVISVIETDAEINCYK